MLYCETPQRKEFGDLESSLRSALILGQPLYTYQESIAMNSDYLTVLKNNRNQIIDITRNILQSESSPEDVFVEGFVDTYIENFDKIGADLTEDYSSSEDLPFGIGVGELLLTAVILPLIVNLITEKLIKKPGRDELNKKIDLVTIILKKYPTIKNPKKLATKIVTIVFK